MLFFVLLQAKQVILYFLDTEANSWSKIILGHQVKGMQTTDHRRNDYYLRVMYVLVLVV